MEKSRCFRPPWYRCWLIRRTPPIWGREDASVFRRTIPSNDFNWVLATCWKRFLSGDLNATFMLRGVLWSIIPRATYRVDSFLAQDPKLIMYADSEGNAILLPLFGQRRPHGQSTSDRPGYGCSWAPGD